ncbi:MAG: peptidyl-prolyl cis-trans isomerase [Vulcanococcus sp.]|uniref:peptidylprolyl isomerase n=1 Tax=Vulcanococcus sp. TaxID=2856995 RepID=UPI0025D03A84|nr:hypothetical protein [Vulcanococcus sp.]MBW0166190.1 peptidyl-prolyl cis-trans isomerase [Vulcanococcus sp.]
MDATSLQQLAGWGYGGLVQRELTRDRLLAGEPPLAPEQKDLAVPLLFQRYKLKTQLEVQRWMVSYGLTEADLDLLAERQLRWQLLCERRFRAQISTLFLKRKSQLDQVVYSLIWVEDEALAQEMFLQLSERESSFEQLWCTLPEKAGQLPTGKCGPTPMGELPEALAELLRVSQPGHVWPPRPAEGGWVLIRLDEFQPAVFSQGHRRDLALELGDQWLQEELSRTPTS